LDTTPSPDRIDRLLSTSPGTPERLLGVDMLLAGLAATHELPTYRSARRALPFSEKPKKQQIHERMVAFCMAQHRRLGRDSLARGLPTDVLRRIFCFVTSDLSHLRLAVAHTETHREDSTSRSCRHATVVMVPRRRTTRACRARRCLVSNQRRFSVQLHLTDVATGELACRELTMPADDSGTALPLGGGDAHPEAAAHLASCHCAGPQPQPRIRPPLSLQADIVFEDGQPLPCSVAPPHLCQPELATIGHGRARVSLRIGRNVLSSKLGKRRLRIRFRPRHPTLRSW